MANLVQIKETFDECDTDKDGRLTEDEFILFAKKALGISEAVDMFRTMCTHYGVRDGKLGWSHLDSLFKTKSTTSTTTSTTIAGPSTASKRRVTSRSPSPGPRKVGASRVSSRQGRSKVRGTPDSLITTTTAAGGSSDGSSGDPISPKAKDSVTSPSASAGSSSMSIGGATSTLSTKDIGAGAGAGGSRSSALRRARSTGAGYHARHTSRSQSGRSREGSLLDEPLDDIEERSEERSSMSPPPSTKESGSSSRLRVKPMASPRGLRRATSVAGTGEDGSSLGRSRRKSSANPPRRRPTGHMRSVTMTDLSGGGLGPDSGDDGSAAVLQMLESKLATSQKEFKKEKQLRKELEEMSKSVIQQNEECKIKIDTLNKEISFLKKKKTSMEKRMNEKIDELKKELSEWKIKLSESEKQESLLLTENEQLNRERNEAFKVIRKMESDFETKIKTLTKKHELNMKQITFGLIESIGIELDIDVSNSTSSTSIDGGSSSSVDLVISEVRKLKEKNQVLKKQSDLLAETLSRKEQSLFEALKAVDDISAMDESLVDSLIDSGHHSVLYGISGTAYRMGGGPTTTMTTGSGTSFGEEDDDDDEMKEGHSKAVIVSPSASSGGGSGSGSGHGRSRSRTSSLFKRLGSIKLRSRVGSGGAAAAAATTTTTSTTTPSHGHGTGTTTTATSSVSTGFRGGRIGSSMSDTSHTAAFYKGAHASHDAKLMFEAGKLAAAAQKRGDSKAAGVQDMTFLSQSLVTDLVSKQDKMDSISLANGALMKQVHELQVQLDHMRRCQEEALSEMRRSGSSAVSSSKHKGSAGVLPPPPARLLGRSRTEDEDDDSEPAFSRSAETTDALD